MSSSSSTEARTAPLLPPGVEIADFRIEAILGRGSRSIVYEATQISLDRRVALKLVAPDPAIAERFRRLEWPEHPHAVSMYAAGVCAHGQFVAMQLVPGSTLAEIDEAGKLDSDRALELLNEVAVALDAAHEAGIVHGDVRAQNVLVDRAGRARLTDFGIGPGPTSIESDAAAFAELVRECLWRELPELADTQGSSAVELVRAAAEKLTPSSASNRARRRRRRAAVAATGVLLAGAALAAIFAERGAEPARAPPILHGAQALGSALTGTGISSVDCSGRAPSGSSPACTVVQTRLPGRLLVAPRDGVIRRWEVRGARGEISLQVLGRTRDTFVPGARTGYELVPDEGLHLFRANLPIRAGELVGVEIAPGAAIGIRTDADGATTARWFDPLTIVARPIDRREGSGFDHELALRVEYLPGAVWKPLGLLTGRSAELAPRGRELATRGIDLGGGRVRTVVLVRLQARVAFDLFDGKRRLARLAIADADPGGRLVSLTRYARPILRMRWSNPNGRTIGNDYAVEARSIALRT
jgi:hypothetical protein